jgi:hypothetical protein
LVLVDDEDPGLAAVDPDVERPTGEVAGDLVGILRRPPGPAARGVFASVAFPVWLVVFTDSLAPLVARVVEREHVEPFAELDCCTL